MRKLFVVLMVALVALTMVGCRLIENSDNGNDVGPAVTTAGVSVAPKVVLPAGATSSSIRDAIAPASVTLSIGTTYVATPTTIVLNSDGTTTLTFPTYTTTTVTTTYTGTLTLTGGTTIIIPLVVSTSSVNGGTAANTITVTITATATGFTYTTSNVNPCDTTNTTSNGTTTGTSTPASFAADLYVTSVTWTSPANVVATLDESLTAPAATIATITPTFVVNLSQAVDSPTGTTALATWTFVCKNLTDGKSQTMTSADIGANAKVSCVLTSAKVITISVLSQTAPSVLRTGSSYAVTLTSTLKKTGDNTITLSGATRTFKVTL